MPEQGQLYTAQYVALSRNSSIEHEFLLIGSNGGLPRKVWILKTGTVMVEPSGEGRMRAMRNPVKEDVLREQGRIKGLPWFGEQHAEDGAILNACALAFYDAFTKKQARWALNNMLIRLRERTVARRLLMKSEAPLLEDIPSPATGTDRNES